MRIVTRFLAGLYIFTFAFGIWSCRHSQNIRQAMDMNTDVHVRGQINGWVKYVDFENKTVQVLTIEDVKRDILFETDDEFMDFFKSSSGIGHVLPLTFVCGNKRNLECNLTKPYVLYVATRKVTPVIVQKNKHSGP